MEWTIQELAARAGVTSRTLRHYDSVGLLPPSRVGENGYRYYNPAAVARLQRILLMRQLGMGLPAIAKVLADEVDTAEGLRAHITALEEERARIERRIRAVRHTLEALEAGAEPRMDVMLSGFNDRYKDEVVSRWGERAYQVSNDWWHGKTLDQQLAWKKDTDDLVAAWVAAAKAGVPPTSDRAQALAARHVRWLSAIPGTPTAEGDRERSIAMVRGLGDMYVDDPRFAGMYDDEAGAAFVRDALHAYARTHM
ncbi:MerR family transcriptional regulator [Streptomonospora nanhaiensis]|uniref:DNA-binding transcriptional MerR regulator n=1 Tax=Streptomonospora nanhaiensis TaxID=1323731 RepID=A0A853BID5_9ACTN|nr:MerR family transcriptional regulator [Streptomonospora nanhaiensis]MBV2366465.1 MerR family transcriptional regulator [Streptomonospora nanhaiensis]MBX9387489.1 MerR family transcriptional regulator [Streptomonospora nanhaiensis]NYI94286.1 DNA-binding transcriptional MerR regulator [Streptomonospora nanhaiensis]